jgi:phosphatidylglycerophosphate synthase
VDPANLRLILIADAPSALLEICGVTLLDRLLRQAQRTGFREALILSATPEAIRGEIARPSWPRESVSVEVRPREPGPIPVATLLAQLGDAESCLVIPGDIYCDTRLLRALAEQAKESVLVDSAPLPTVGRPSWPPVSVGGGQDGRPPVLVPSLPTQAQSPFSGPAHLTKPFLQSRPPNETLADALKNAITTGAIESLDAADFPRHIPGMRRDIRPLCLPASTDSRHQIEAIIFDSAQNGTLDLPAYAHAPVETFVVSLLCRMSISPNQITMFGFLFGILGTICFATTHFAAGLVIALIFGVLDGLDGKLARVKIETTSRGEWEHRLDVILEYSWWIALGWGLRKTGQLPSAFLFTALLLGGELLSQAAKGYARHLTGRLLDDLSGFDRFFRLIAGRRNVYVWLLVIAWCWSGGARAYRMISIWAVLSAAVYMARAVSIHLSRRRAPAT